MKPDTINQLTIGYARVSSCDNRQELGLEVQVEALSHCDRLFIERDSGGNDERTKLKKALKLAKKSARDGIETKLVIYKLDRLTRKMFKLLAIIEELQAHDIELISLRENIETKSLTGKLLCLLLGYVAEMELENIRSRTKDGLRKAKEKGIKLGNQGLSKEKEDEIIELYRQKYKPFEIAQTCGVCRATVYRVLNRRKIKFHRT
ncbi:TPA: recombinase family protein [Streptococcus suis]|nr:recombinase family protein [Streptococcus suis]NQJ19444.1 recombinase family protein [Streptococcus suis]NQK56247.1 recombinase family protein [Streptococcus suis]NQK57171.1 recombinase family protein [Streptococcus suis]NQN95115.1 recombinase family protein [Streptococcus suis]